MKKYYVDKNYILGVLASKQKTVQGFCQEIGVKRCYFYYALNKGYKAPRSVFISKVASALKLDMAIVWRDE